MARNKITKIPKRKQSALQSYLKRWEGIALRGLPAHRSKAEKGLKQAYLAGGIDPPQKIIWCDSPKAALDAYLEWKYACPQREAKSHSDLLVLSEIYDWVIYQVKEELYARFDRKVLENLSFYFESGFDSYRFEYNFINPFSDPYRSSRNRWSELMSKIKIGQHDRKIHTIEQCLRRKLYKGENDLSLDIISRNEAGLEKVYVCDNLFHSSHYKAFEYAHYDFLAAELGMVKETALLRGLMRVARHGGWLIPTAKICFICERPQYHRNPEGELHADGHPAIEYPDGWGIFFWDGLIFPDKYGLIPSDQWKTAWILEEENLELRRILQAGVGYDKMLREFQGEELDSWREYALYKLSHRADWQDTILLTMTCPSTQSRYSMRVPPEMTTVREAVKWVNWGIEASEFSLET